MSDEAVAAEENAPSNEEEDYSYDDDDDEGPGIELGVRQPSFTNMKGDMILKSGASMRDIHLTASVANQAPIVEDSSDDEGNNSSGSANNDDNNNTDNPIIVLTENIQINNDIIQTEEESKNNNLTNNDSPNNINSENNEPNNISTKESVKENDSNSDDQEIKDHSDENKENGANNENNDNIENNDSNDNNDNNDNNDDDGSTSPSFEEDEEEGCGLMMDIRTTTFRNLADMIPRGYGQIESNANELSQNKTDTNGASGVAPSPSTLNALEEMKMRNQEKWKLLGYDPTSGKGNMKGSVTLSNFKPSTIMFGHNSNNSMNNNANGLFDNSLSKLMSNSSSNENVSGQTANNFPVNSIAEESDSSSLSNLPPSSVPKQVLQSYSMCIRPKAQIKRVNSSTDPSKFIKAESDSDESGFTESSSDENDDQFLDENNPLPFKMDTNSLLAPMQKEIEVKPISPQWSQILKSNNVEVQQLREVDTGKMTATELLFGPNAIVPSSTSTNPSTGKPTAMASGKSSAKSSVISHKMSTSKEHSAQMSSKMVVPNVSSSRSSAAPKGGYDYSAYDDPDFDYKTASQHIPPGLLPVIKHPKKSIVFRAICGQSMSSYPKGIVLCVITDIRTYLDKCVSKNMIEESAYLSGIIDDIKQVISEKPKESKFEELEERCQNAEESLERKQQFWQTQKAILISEKEVRLQEIELRYQDEMANLEALWNSDKKRQQFNKPSAQLIALRQHVQAHLAGKRFEEAAQLATKAEQLDKYETDNAAQRMRTAFSEAADRLRQKFENEKKTVTEQFEARKCSLLAQEEADLRPVENRVQKYQTAKEDTKDVSKRSTTAISRGVPQVKRPFIKAPVIPTAANQKLRLPPLKSGPKRIETVLSRQSAPIQ